MIREAQEKALIKFVDIYGMDAVVKMDRTYWTLNNRSNPEHFTEYSVDQCRENPRNKLENIMFDYYKSIYTGE